MCFLSLEVDVPPTLQGFFSFSYLVAHPVGGSAQHCSALWWRGIGEYDRLARLISVRSHALALAAPRPHLPLCRYAMYTSVSHHGSTGQQEVPPSLLVPAGSGRRPTG